MLETKSKTGETEKCRARPTSHSGYLCVVCREMGSMSTSPALDYKQTCFWLNMLWLVEWLLITNECQVRKTKKDQITCLHCLSEGAFIPITNWLNSFMAWWYEISGALGVIKIIIHIMHFHVSLLCNSFSAWMEWRYSPHCWGLSRSRSLSPPLIRILELERDSFLVREEMVRSREDTWNPDNHKHVRYYVIFRGFDAVVAGVWRELLGISEL